MCFAELSELDLFKNGPNYCPRHPEVDMGDRHVHPMGYFKYQLPCSQCAKDFAAHIPKDLE